MEHFEKGQTYTYNNIQAILDNTFDYVIEDLKKERTKHIDDGMGKLMFELHTTMILALYKSALLKGVENENA